MWSFMDRLQNDISKRRKVEELNKQKLIQEISGLSKKEIFKEEEIVKLTLWQKIKIMIWGN